MAHKVKLLLFGLFLAIVRLAAQPVIIPFNGVPTGSCSFVMQAVDLVNHNFYYCPAGSWVLVAGVSPSGNNTWTGTNNFTNALTIPIGAGLSPSSNGSVGYDSTANLYRFGFNGTSRPMAMMVGSFNNNDCLVYNSATGGIASNGAGCANGSISGQTTNHALKATSATASTASMNFFEETTGADSFSKAAAYANCSTVTYSNGGTSTIDLSQANCYSLTIATSGTTTLAVSNPPTGGAAFRLYLVQDATTAGSVTFPASFSNAAAPSLGLSSRCYQDFAYNSVTTKYEGGPQSCTDAAGVIQASEAAAPTTATYAGAGKGAAWFDSTNHIFSAKENNSSTVSNTVIPKDCTTGGNNVTQKINADGTVTCGILSAAVTFAVNPQTTTYQVLAGDFSAGKIITVASGTFTITLVASASQPTNGQFIWVANYGSGVVTIARSGQNINGGTSSYLLQSGSATNPSLALVVSDGTNYFISGGFTNPMTTAGDILYAGTTGLPTRLAAGTAGKFLSPGTTPTYNEFTDSKIIPAAACPNGTAAAGWSYAASQSGVANICRAGTNNLGGVLQGIPNTGATYYFEFELPTDWDTASQPFVGLWYASGANTTGTVIWTISTACYKGDGSITDDPAFVANSAFGTQTMAAANRGWQQSGQLTTVTSGNNCVPQGTMLVKLVLSGTATSAINISKAIVTVPRLITAIQAE